MEWIFIISFAIVLASATGLRAFLPLTIVSIMAKLNLVTIPASSHFITFITDDRVLIFLICATVIEILSDKIPVVDNFLDGVYSFVKPILSLISSFGIVFSKLEFWQAAIIAITLSFVSTSTAMVTKGVVRLTSSATTGGTANPFVSLIEDILVTIKMVLSIIFIWLLPILAILVILTSSILGFTIFKIGYRILKVEKTNT